MTETATRAPRAVYWRRRAVVLLVIVAALLTAGALVGDVGSSAEAGLSSNVAGQAVVRPGDTLWDLAADTAPDGINIHQQLRALRDLNGLRSDQVPAWTIVLLPAW